MELPKKELELYIHIPFCVRKCEYCDFLSMPVDVTIRRHYIDRLLEEIKNKGPMCSSFHVSTIFFGGGTPSILSEMEIESLVGALRQNFHIQKDAEITLECNPGTLTKGKLAFCRTAGINRLSLGLQSAIDQELQILGRIHTYRDFLVSYDLARKAGFSNINVDVMFALPGQRLQDWEYTLKRVLMLKPEHISAYSLIVEEGTPFYSKYGEDEQRRQRGEVPWYLPDEETEREMYRMTKELLMTKGYRRYEISNYALPGKECRHNIGYWRLTPYLGLGLGSSSLMEHVRFSNPPNLREYLLGATCNLQKIMENAKGQNVLHRDGIVCMDKKQQMEEFMFLGLRLTEGIERSRFRDNFGVELEGIYGNTLIKLQQQGLLGQKEGRIFLTEEGISLSNYVLSKFLLDG